MRICLYIYSGPHNHHKLLLLSIFKIGYFKHITA